MPPYPPRVPRFLRALWVMMATCMTGAQASAQAAPPDPASESAVPPAAAPAAPPAAAPAATPAGAANPASAAAPPPAQPRTGPALVPPRLLQFAPATYPEPAVATGISGTVELELVLDEQGKVTASRVVSGPGAGLDEAAQQASLGLQFAPATRDGQPIPAKIRFPYVFELTTAAPPPEEAPPLSELVGEVQTVEGDALPGTLVILTAPDGAEQRTQTDPEGHFAFPPLIAGEYLVRLVAEDYDERVEQEHLVPGERTTGVYKLRERPDPNAYGAIARVKPPPREVTRRSINRTQLSRIPGTRGDALRAIELLPGVGRPPFGAGVLIIRGSAPQDSQVQLEGASVPLLYHFGGLTSFFNSQMLESVEFFPGNFSTRYGRRRGGIVEVNVRDPNREHYAGMLDVNLLDSSLLLEGPITDKWQFAVAGRRSYADLLLQAAPLGDEVSFVAAPVYYDYQLITTYQPSSKDRLRLMLFGSSDRLALLFEEPSEETGGIDDLGFSTRFHRAHLSWYSHVTNRVDHDMELAVERRILDFGAGDLLSFVLKSTAITGRSEWRARLSRQLRLIGGLDMSVSPGRFAYLGPVPNADEGDPNSQNMDLASADKVTRERNFLAFEPAAYAELDLDVQPMRFVLGARVDYFGLSDALTFDPRLTTFLTLNERTRLKAGVGLFSQAPQPQENDAVLGNPDLKPMRTIHTTLGIEHEPAEGIEMGAEAFYKHLYSLVISTENGAPPGFVNGGRGRIYGLELSAKVEPRGRFFGYLSYTLSRSERQERDQPYRLFDFDQTHILTVVGVYRLGAGWELGGTFRLVSGNPLTPVTGGITDTTYDVVQPIYGDINSARNDMFHRLDVLIRKTWEFESWKLALYLDVQNAYNRRNPEGLVYGPRYKTKANISGLPILPNLGVRGEF